MDADSSISTASVSKQCSAYNIYKPSNVCHIQDAEYNGKNGSQDGRNRLWLHERLLQSELYSVSRPTILIIRLSEIHSLSVVFSTRVNEM